MYSNNIRCEEVDWLPKHAGFSFDTADSPAHDAKSVDHGGVGVRAYERIWIVHSVFFQDTARQIFQVDLMDNADPRRHHLESFKRLHAPLKELITRAVALKLKFHVFLQGVWGARIIYLNRVVDNQVHRH